MADYFAVTSTPLPIALHGADGGFAIRKLTERERLALEDRFFAGGTKLPVDREATAVMVPQSQAAGARIEDVGVLVEFALGVLSVSGFQPVSIVAVFREGACSDAIQRVVHADAADPPLFVRRVVKSAASAWLKSFFTARQNAKDKLHITADRFVRYLRGGGSHDALVDLCICLESLVGSETEIAFRFGACLAKISGLKNAEEVHLVLSDLYNLRSKIVHGADFTKAHKKLQPGVVRLRYIARAILTVYVLYMTEHSKDDWQKHLKSSLFV